MPLPDNFDVALFERLNREPRDFTPDEEHDAHLSELAAGFVDLAIQGLASLPQFRSFHPLWSLSDAMGEIRDVARGLRNNRQTIGDCILLDEEDDE